MILLHHRAAAALAIAAALAAPAAADPLAELRAAVGTCVEGMGDPDGTARRLAAAGWEAIPDDSGYTPGARKGDIEVFLAGDATACTVISQTVPTAAMIALLAEMIGPEQGETEMGCPRFVLPDGREASVHGAEPDPACEGEANSAVTIYHPGG
jgi:hypothetical protein